MRKLTGVTTAVLLAGCSGMAVQHLSDGGRLAPCNGPHCVSSQDQNPKRRVEPLAYTMTPAQAQARLVEVLQGMEHVRIEKNHPGYVHATFKSAAFGFIDDVEFVFVSGKHIDVRSSARTGYYDFEVNRKRVAEIRARFDKTKS